MTAKIFSVFVLLFASSFIFSVPVSAQTVWTSTQDKMCIKSYTTADGQATDVATIQGLECLVANVLATIITIIGIAAFVMFIFGAFRYLTAGTNTKGVQGGKDAITYAVIGIFVALASFVIVRFIESFTGVSLLNFSVGLPTQ